ncbi:hypothetical protein [Kytococcus sp. HMSC28H12]|uniref:hypothetical protein n=1 Tax=Kytococcus sp. HMSC28H12 TaxID=1581067 RepID=UPI001EDA89AE|nr:hypothetical protein [Kytococcus sp. HMSC28H12]
MIIQGELPVAYSTVTAMGERSAHGSYSEVSAPLLCHVQSLSRALSFRRPWCRALSALLAPQPSACSGEVEGEAVGRGDVADGVGAWLLEVWLLGDGPVDALGVAGLDGDASERLGVGVAPAPVVEGAAGSGLELVGPGALSSGVADDVGLTFGGALGSSGPAGSGPPEQAVRLSRPTVARATRRDGTVRFMGLPRVCVLGP